MKELKSLGRYQIKGVLGKGAMGLVYDGLDPTLDRRVAIKTILTSELDEGTAKHYSLRFRREVRAVARLNHPHIVQVYDFGAEGDLAYIVMEYIEGKELKDYFDAKHAFNLATILRIMTELLDGLDGLDFAHEAGVIHRDIKPANVMLDVAGHAKLADFGVARLTEAEGEGGELTRAGAMVGTPSYMSPEQIQGQAIDRRTDIFSTGVLFYQFLTGQKPFEGGHWVLAKKIVQDDPVWPSSLVQIPSAIDRVVARAMAKDPAHRFQSARNFAAALKRISEGKAPEDPNEAPPPGLVTGPAPGGEAEKEFWEGVKDSSDPDDLALYVEQFPHGVFVEQAQRRMSELRGKKA